MNKTNPWKLNPADREVLRNLALRKMEIAFEPLNLERKRLWLEQHSGGSTRPMVLAEWGGVLDKLRPFAPVLKCTEEWAQNVERELRQGLWVYEELKDDHVVEPWFDVSWFVTCSNYGVEPVMHKVEGEHLTARSWDAPITDIARDFSSASSPDLFRGPRQVRSLEKPPFRGFCRYPAGSYPGRVLVDLGDDHCRHQSDGLEPLMLFMYDDPAGLHRLMKFLMEDHLAYAKWLEAEGLLSLNNENDYNGSGSIGYTRDLPPADRKTGMPVRTRDQWVLLESQENRRGRTGAVRRVHLPLSAADRRTVRSGLLRLLRTCPYPLGGIEKSSKNLKAVSVAPLCKSGNHGGGLGGKLHLLPQTESHPDQHGTFQ